MRVSVNLAGSMRLEVASRESSHFWRQTDDGRYPCVFCMATRPAKVIWCGHYVLGVVTEETSDSKRPIMPTSKNDNYRYCGHSTSVRLQGALGKGLFFAS